MTARVLGGCDGSVPRAAVWAALQRVEDPELPLSVVDLGLIRRLEIAAGRVRIGLTYTSLACPCNEMIREDVEAAVAAVPGVAAVQVDEVLEPWTREDVTPQGRALLRAVAVV
jgi:metal-sulfur cluster biosynthetic enzyme